MAALSGFAPIRTGRNWGIEEAQSSANVASGSPWVTLSLRVFETRSHLASVSEEHDKGLVVGEVGGARAQRRPARRR